MIQGEIIFAESQKFKQWWLWLLLIAIPVIFVFSLYMQMSLGLQFGNRPLTDAGLITTTLLSVLPLALFYSFRLETEIKRDGIYVRFFPIHITFRKYSWEKITKSFVRQYKPIGEYGGWGIRGLGKKRALNVSGNIGLQLEFVSGNTMLIGTQKPEELTEALKKLGQLKS